MPSRRAASARLPPRALERALDEAPLQRRHRARADRDRRRRRRRGRAAPRGGSRRARCEIALVDAPRTPTSRRRARARGGARARCPARRTRAGGAIASSETARARLPVRARWNADQERDVAAARAQRRHLDLDHRQPVDRDPRAASRPARSGAPGALVAATMRARRAGSGSSPPTRSKVPSCEHAQELGLQRRVEIADLVEEERAAAGRLEAARAARGRAGERALLVAEELALDQRRRQRREVDGDERLARARRVARGWRAPPAPCRCRSRR